MQSIRKIIILMFAALMAFSPLVAQAAAALEGSASATTMCHDVMDCSDQTSAAAYGGASGPDSNHEADKEHCAGCCMSHNSALPIGSAVNAAVPSPKPQTMKLPTDWAGAVDRAPDALIRPPRA